MGILGKLYLRNPDIMLCERNLAEFLYLEKLEIRVLIQKNRELMLVEESFNAIELRDEDY